MGSTPIIPTKKVSRLERVLFNCTTESLLYCSSINLKTLTRMENIVSYAVIKNGKEVALLTKEEMQELLKLHPGVEFTQK